MIEIFKKLFGKNQEEKYIPDPPGRTFKRILTGRYFGCEDLNADENQIAKAKKEKIDQIKELELVPMFVRFTYDDTSHADEEPPYFCPCCLPKRSVCRKVEHDSCD